MCAFLSWGGSAHAWKQSIITSQASPQHPLKRKERELFIISNGNCTSTASFHSRICRQAWKSNNATDGSRCLQRQPLHADIWHTWRESMREMKWLRPRALCLLLPIPLDTHTPQTRCSPPSLIPFCLPFPQTASCFSVYYPYGQNTHTHINTRHKSLYIQHNIEISPRKASC